jgi:hypothetical protein
MERVQDLDPHDRFGRLENRIDQVDQDLRIPLVTKDPVEGVIDFGINA